MPSAPKDAAVTAPAATSEANVDPAEIERFGSMAARWWDAEGVFRPLHQLAPARLGFVRDVVTAALGLPGTGLKPLAGVRLIDIGCGGGLVAEPLARLGATVTGIDLAADSIAAARAHAADAGVAGRLSRPEHRGRRRRG